MGHFFLFLDARYAKPHIRRLSALRRMREGVEENENDDENENAIDLCAVERELEVRCAVESKHSWNVRGRALCVRASPTSCSGAVLRSFALCAVFFVFWGVWESMFSAGVRYDLDGVVGWAISDPIRAFTPWQIVFEVPSHTDA